MQQRSVQTLPAAHARRSTPAISQSAANQASTSDQGTHRIGWNRARGGAAQAVQHGEREAQTRPAAHARRSTVGQLAAIQSSTLAQRTHRKLRPNRHGRRRTRVVARSISQPQSRFKLGSLVLLCQSVSWKAAGNTQPLGPVGDSRHRIPILTGLIILHGSGQRSTVLIIQDRANAGLTS